MSYTSKSIVLDPAAIALAKQQLQSLIEANADQLASYSFAAAIGWLESQLPEMRDVVTLMTWANAVEEISAQTLDNPLWVQALQTEGYTLRLRAQLLPRVAR